MPPIPPMPPMPPPPPGMAGPFFFGSSATIVSLCFRQAASFNAKRWNFLLNEGVAVVVDSSSKGSGGTLFVQPGSESAAAVEATAQDKFKFETAGIVIEFDAELFIPVAPKLDRTFGQFGVFFIRAVSCPDCFADISGGRQRMRQWSGIDQDNVVPAVV